MIEHSIIQNTMNPKLNCIAPNIIWPISNNIHQEVYGNRILTSLYYCLMVHQSACSSRSFTNDDSRLDNIVFPLTRSTMKALGIVFSEIFDSLPPRIWGCIIGLMPPGCSFKYLCSEDCALHTSLIPVFGVNSVDGMPTHSQKCLA